MTENDQLARMEPPRRISILGARIDDVVWDEALARIQEWIRSGTPHQVMTPNPEFVMIARRNAAFRALLDRVDLAPADGVGLRWAARLLGTQLREVVPGSDLVERMGGPAGARQERWFLLGAAEGVAEAAGTELQRRYPGLEIAGTYSGAPGAEYDDEICGRIEAAKPVDLLLVAYGAPGQDLWIARNQPRLKIPVAMGVGGTFNFIAGRSPRPPALIKRLGLIWLFRLISEPWRWRRQIVLLEFAGLVLREALRRRIGGQTTGTRSM